MSNLKCYCFIIIEKLDNKNLRFCLNCESHSPYSLNNKKEFQVIASGISQDSENKGNLN